MTKTVDLTPGQIAGQRYFERWAAMRAQGHQPVILFRARHPEQWRAWRNFYRIRGLKALEDLMQDGKAEKVVPCLDPADFEETVQPDRRVKDD